MARFRPSKLFRRFSSRSDVPAASKSRSASQHSPTPPDTADLPIPPDPVSPPRQLRKSTSLPRLRKRSNTQGTAQSAKSGGDTESAGRGHGDSVPGVPESIKEVSESVLLLPTQLGRSVSAEEGTTGSETETVSWDKSSELAEERKTAGESAEELRLPDVEAARKPIVVVEHPTPDVVEEVRTVQQQQGSPESQQFESGQATLATTSPEGEEGQAGQQAASADIPKVEAPGLQGETTTARKLARRPSIIDTANAKITKTLLNAPPRGHDRSTSDSSDRPTTSATDYFDQAILDMAAILRRKIWVKRPGASATLVQIKEDDLVDDVRDMILRKYANSLGKTFDAPDMTLQILSRPEQGANRMERTLGPEEEICRTIDQMYPGGQTVDEALVVNVPQRRTPKVSPRVFQQPQYQQPYHTLDDYRPLENGSDYFPPMPALIPTTIPQTAGSQESRTSHHQQPVAVQPAAVPHVTTEHPRSISVLNTGQLPPLPSPGGQSRRHQHRPKYQRQPTSSPTILSHPTAGPVTVAAPVSSTQPHLVHRQSTRPRLDSSASEAHRPNGISVPAPPPLPTPPAPEAPPTNKDTSAPPTPSAAVAPVGIGPHSRPGRPKKPRKPTPETQNGTASSRRKKESSSASSPHPNSAIANLLDASVPPINVLIVEDNIINLRILEGLMKRLKVRWQTAMNGQIAVEKWKAGGFHLVLMDIQMPVMNGLAATKEIRRLERANSIGVFSSITPDDEPRDPVADPAPDKSPEKPDTTLPGLKEGLIKSPVIIVALTASSLQSDRHEALAAGCNDFLTKPVNFVWLERKVKEWGCMQALIDFDGWRRWKEFAEREEAGKSVEEKAREKEKEEKERSRAEKMAKLQERQGRAREEKRKRLSVQGSVEEGEEPQGGKGGKVEVGAEMG